MAFKSKYTGPQVEGLLDQMASGCITVDSVLSTTSTNAVQNKVVTAELNKKGTYSKPSAGIPKSDLAAAVQTSLGKADTALQSYTEQYKGTVTGVKINGTTKNPSSGVVDLGTVITAHQDISGKQDKLVSGTNIKNVYTSNGDVDILGSGELHFASILPGTSKVIATGIWNDYDIINITAEGLEFIPEVASLSPGWTIHRTGDGSKFLSDDGTYKTISEGGATNKKVVLTSDEEMILKPNEVVVVFTMISNLTITGFENTPWNDNLDLEENGAAFYDEYTVIFNNTIGSNFTLTMPDSVLWANGEMPQIDNGYYELSITRMAFESPDNNVYKAVLTQFK